MPVDPGVKKFFNSLVWVSRLGAGRLLSDGSIDRRGMEGSVNLSFGDGDDAVWHCRMSSKSVQFAQGPGDGAMGTVRMTADVFLQLLSGRTSMSTAQMTGRVRVEGEGHSSMVLSSLISQTRLRMALPGLRGWFRRRFVRSVLQKSPTRYELIL